MIVWLGVAALLAAWTVASFSFARAAERHATARPPRSSFWAVAAAVAVAGGALWLRATPASALACGIACIGLIVAADADARTGYLFDAVTLPAALLATFAAIAGGMTGDAFAGIAILVGGFGAIVLGSRGRLMGLGDVKAMFALGAAFGPYESLIAILAACCSGIAIAMLTGQLRRGASLPFGPHLAAGSAFALVTGDFIQHRMMGL